MKRRFTLLTAVCLAVVVAVPCLVRPVLARYEGFAGLFGNETHAFSKAASYQLCFVPDGKSCQSLIISAIDGTQKKLRIQAYSFTSTPIAAAVKRAKTRGVDVKVILDKSQASPRYAVATYLRNADINVVIDTKPAIAHNKVMIFDDSAVFTGSFNFTKSAQERNAENGILIQGDANIVRSYSDNWSARYKVSTPYQ
ncbi:phospholipase D family nuclease [Paraburkholderia sediminicola]|uniref:phospholipase D family nuclease n=1 Tax=Paraburkholderia sediminicola TaxID=458836 RepID=UPI0038BD03BE